MDLRDSVFGGTLDPRDSLFGGTLDLRDNILDPSTFKPGTLLFLVFNFSINLESAVEQADMFRRKK